MKRGFRSLGLVVVLVLAQSAVVGWTTEGDANAADCSSFVRWGYAWSKPHQYGLRSYGNNAIAVTDPVAGPDVCWGNSYSSAGKVTCSGCRSKWSKRVTAYMQATAVAVQSQNCRSSAWCAGFYGSGTYSGFTGPMPPYWIGGAYR